MQNLKFKILFTISLLLYIQIVVAQNKGSQKTDPATYDFVPGEDILFEDNFAETKIGQFPKQWEAHRWNDGELLPIKPGYGSVQKVHGINAFMITGDAAAWCTPIIKSTNFLQDPFSLEFDYQLFSDTISIDVAFAYLSSYGGAEFYINDIGNLGVHCGSGDDRNSKTIEYPGLFNNSSWHHLAALYKENRITIYIDQYKVLANEYICITPKTITFWGGNPTAITNVRITANPGVNNFNKILTDPKFVTHAIHFDVNKAIIKQESMGFINQLADWLKKNPAIKLEIDGYTDNDGTSDANVILSKQRAEAVKDLVVTMGIDSNRLSTNGFGASYPIDENVTPKGKANNRRVEFMKM